MWRRLRLRSLACDVTTRHVVPQHVQPLSPELAARRVARESEREHLRPRSRCASTFQGRLTGAASLYEPPTSGAGPSAAAKARLPAGIAALRSTATPAQRIVVAPQARAPVAYPVASTSKALHPAESFVVLSESQYTPARPGSPAAPAKGKGKASAHDLFDLLSSRTDVDHPICAECADALGERMAGEIDELKRERERYLAFEREAKARGAVRKLSDAELAQRRREIDRVLQERDTAEAQLRSVERQRDRLDAEAAALDAEERALAAEEAQCVDDHHASLNQQVLDGPLALRARAAGGARSSRQSADSSRARHARARAPAQDRRLQCVEPYSMVADCSADAFCIGHDGGLATINGLRLGRLPNVPVDWPEINAAWGHTLLLLVTLARRSGLTFETYRPIPLASASKIERIPDKAVVELYGSGDFVFGRLWHNRRFDSAMVAFLDLLRQLMQHALKADPSLRLPFACVGSIVERAELAASTRTRSATLASRSSSRPTTSGPAPFDTCCCRSSYCAHASARSERATLTRCHRLSACRVDGVDRASAAAYVSRTCCLFGVYSGVDALQVAGPLESG